MRQKSEATKVSSEQVVREIRRATRKQCSAEEKIRIVLDGLRGEHSIAELCSPSLVGGTRHRNYIAALGAPLDRVFTGYDAVDNEHFRKGADGARCAKEHLRQELGLPSRFFMGCLRFEAKKTLSRLLHAYARYRESAGEAAWSQVVVGDGELKGELLALRTQLALEAHIQFPGPKGYWDLPK